MMKNKKSILPAINLYLLFSIFYYFFGRYDWKIPSKMKLFVFLVFIQTCLNVGYYIKTKMINKFNNGIEDYDINYERIQNLGLSENARKLFLISCFSIIIFQFAWVITVLGRFSISNVLDNIGQNYYERLAFSSEKSVLIMQIRTLFWGITLFAYPIGFVFFRSMKTYEKVIFIITMIVDVLASLNMGISKNIGDIVLIYICYVIITETKLKANKSHKSHKIRNAIIVLVIFFVIFNLIQTSRISETASYKISNPYYKFSGTRETTIFDSILGTKFATIIDQLGAYVSHGYTGLAYSLELPFENTYGIGFSRSLIEYFDYYLGINVSNLTYPARIQSVFGWPNGMYWPTAYSWFASAVSFYGLPLVMIFIGWCIASIEERYRKYKDIYSLAILSQMFILCIYLPANAQLFQSRASLFGTLEIVMVYIISGRSIRNANQQK